MLDNSSKQLFKFQGFGILITMFVLNGLYISSELINVFKPIRYSLIFLTLLYLISFFIIIIKRDKIRNNEFFAIVFHSFLLFYALIIAHVNGGLVLIETRHYLFIILSLILTMFAFRDYNQSNMNIMSSSNSPKRMINRLVLNSNLQSKFALNFNQILPLLMFLTPFILIYTGNFVIFPIPQILFNLDDGSVYSQSTSTYFSIGGIVFTYLVLCSQKRVSTVIFSIIAFAMIAMSALGGARGDFLIGCIVVFAMIFRKFSLSYMLYIAIIFMVSFFLIVPYIVIFFDDLLIVQRFMVLFDDGLGERGVLIQQSIDLLKDKPVCLVFGCGFNYFQAYYNYEFGLYPHNIFIESIITYGILIGGALVLLTTIGAMYGFFSSHHSIFLYWVFLYFLGVTLKSGSLFSYYPIAVMIFFSYLGLMAVQKFTAKVLALT